MDADIEQDALLSSALEAMRRNELARLNVECARYFTFPFEGDALILTDDLRAKIQAHIGEPLVEAILPGLEGQTTLVPESSLEPKR